MLVNKQEGMIKALFFLFTQKSSDVGYSHLVLENIDLICSIPRSWVVIRHRTQCRLSLVYLLQWCQYLIFLFFPLLKRELPLPKAQFLRLCYTSHPGCLRLWSRCVRLLFGCLALWSGCLALCIGGLCQQQRLMLPLCSTSDLTNLKFYQPGDQIGLESLRSSWLKAGVKWATIKLILVREM